MENQTQTKEIKENPKPTQSINHQKLLLKVQKKKQENKLRNGRRSPLKFCQNLQIEDELGIHLVDEADLRSYFSIEWF